MPPVAVNVPGDWPSAFVQPIDSSNNEAKNQTALAHKYLVDVAIGRFRTQQFWGITMVGSRLHRAENRSYALTMPVLETEAAAVRRQLEEVLKSPGFARNDRLSRFLRFVVERHLEGRSQELKESVIGIEVFGREPT